MSTTFDYRADVAKVDDELGLVFGWAIVCKEDGAEYFDKQGDHIPEESMLEASLDFMLNSRAADDMHDGDAHGTVVFAFPVTESIAKQAGLESKKTGLLVAMKPSPEVFDLFKTGKRKQFSIGGARIDDEDVEDQDDDKPEVTE